MTPVNQLSVGFRFECFTGASLPCVERLNILSGIKARDIAVYSLGFGDGFSGEAAAPLANGFRPMSRTENTHTTPLINKKTFQSRLSYDQERGESTARLTFSAFAVRLKGLRLLRFVLFLLSGLLFSGLMRSAARVATCALPLTVPVPRHPESEHRAIRTPLNPVLPRSDRVHRTLWNRAWLMTRVLNDVLKTLVINQAACYVLRINHYISSVSTRHSSSC